jgi:hypothetical protein
MTLPFSFWIDHSLLKVKDIASDKKKTASACQRMKRIVNPPFISDEERGISIRIGRVTQTRLRVINAVSSMPKPVRRRTRNNVVGLLTERCIQDWNFILMKSFQYEI